MASGAASPTLIYILGLPFSGTTLFAAALGNSDGVVNCGEISFVEKDFMPWKRCSCGARLAECGFWAPLRAEAARDRAAEKPALALEPEAGPHPLDTRMLPWHAHLRLFLGRPLDAVFPEAELRDYAARHARFIRAAARQAGALFVVDASKSTRRLEAMLRHGDLPIRVVVVSRQPDHAFGALLKRARRRDPSHRLIKAPWHLAAMVYHLRCMDRLRRTLPPDRVIELSYESLVTRPGAVEATLSHWLGTPVCFKVDAENVLPMRDQHVYTGSRWLARLDAGAPTVTLRPPLARPELTPAEARLFAAARRLIPALKPRPERLLPSEAPLRPRSAP